MDLSQGPVVLLDRPMHFTTSHTLHTGQAPVQVESTVEVSGSLTITGTAPLALEASSVLLVRGGTVQVEGPVQLLTGGRVDIRDGAGRFRAGAAAAGTIAITAPSVLEVDGAAVVFGCLSGDGALRLRDGLATRDGAVPCRKELALEFAAATQPRRRAGDARAACQASRHVWAPCGAYAGPATLREGTGLSLRECPRSHGGSVTSTGSLTFRNDSFLELHGAPAPRFEAVAVSGTLWVHLHADLGPGAHTILRYNKLMAPGAAVVACGCPVGWTCAVTIGPATMSLEMSDPPAPAPAPPAVIVIVCCIAVAVVGLLIAAVCWWRRRQQGSLPGAKDTFRSWGNPRAAPESPDGRRSEKDTPKGSQGAVRAEAALQPCASVMERPGEAAAPPAFQGPGCVAEEMCAQSVSLTSP